MKTRNKEIIDAYLSFLDKHIEDVVSGDAMEFLELNQIAGKLFISHTHLSDTIQKATGHHPCYFYDQKIIDKAIQLLTETDIPVAEVAIKLTYDPSNFSKFFKKWMHVTPGEYRRNYLQHADKNKKPKSSP